MDGQYYNRLFYPRSVTFRTATQRNDVFVYFLVFFTVHFYTLEINGRKALAKPKQPKTINQNHSMVVRSVQSLREPKSWSSAQQETHPLMGSCISCRPNPKISGPHAI